MIALLDSILDDLGERRRGEQLDEGRQPAYAAPTAETLRTTMHSVANLIRLLL